MNGTLGAIAAEEREFERIAEILHIVTREQLESLADWAMLPVRKALRL